MNKKPLFHAENCDNFQISVFKNSVLVHQLCNLSTKPVLLDSTEAKLSGVIFMNVWPSHFLQNRGET